jgi:hypothetical protein
MNTHSESYEWYKMDNADEEEFQLLDEKINIIEHAPKGQPSLHKDPPKETGPGKFHKLISWKPSKFNQH